VVADVVARALARRPRLAAAVVAGGLVLLARRAALRRVLGGTALGGALRRRLRRLSALVLRADRGRDLRIGPRPSVVARAVAGDLDRERERAPGFGLEELERDRVHGVEQPLDLHGARLRRVEREIRELHDAHAGAVG